MESVCRVDGGKPVTRKDKQALADRLDRIEAPTGEGPPLAIVPTDAELEALLTGEGPPAPIATTADVPAGEAETGLGIAVPDRWPPSLAGELAVTFADVVDAWRALPPAERETERTARRRRDDPIPPVLEEPNSEADQ